MPKGIVLDDYSGISGAGAAFQGFAKGFQDAKDHELKRQEFDAKMKAHAAQVERDATEAAIKMREHNVQKNQLTGALEDAPLTPRQQSAQRLKEISEGVKIDPKTGDYVTDPTTPKMKGIEASKVKFNTNQEYRQSLIDDKADTKDRREHERVLTRISSNPNAKARLTQYQNLDNALKVITDAESLTPQQIHEFQQAVRSNLGIKGTSGVGEREETYFKTLGLNAASFQQFLTGDPANIAKDSKLLKHFIDLARVEQKNIAKQFDKSLGAASAGHASMYARRADLKADLQDALSAQRESLGLVPGGMVGQGLVGEPKAGAGTTSPAHPQDNAAIKWARENPSDPRSAAILKANGL